MPSSVRRRTTASYCSAVNDGGANRTSTLMQSLQQLGSSTPYAPLTATQRQQLKRGGAIGNKYPRTRLGQVVRSSTALDHAARCSPSPAAVAAITGGLRLGRAA